MCRKICLYVGLALMALGLLLPGSASAAAISITNASFEDPVLPNDYDQTASGVVPGWTSVFEAGYVYNVGDQSGGYGMYDALGSGTPRGGQGTNIWFGVWNNNGLDQTLTSTIQAGTYTLTMGAGTIVQQFANRANFEIRLGTPAFPDLSKYVGSGAELVSGEFVDRSTTLVVPSDSLLIGSNIQIGVRMSLYQADPRLMLDNVRLDFVPVPEPSAVVLLISGVLGLLAYAWRKRR